MRIHQRFAARVQHLYEEVNLRTLLLLSFVKLKQQRSMDRKRIIIQYSEIGMVFCEVFTALIKAYRIRHDNIHIHSALPMVIVKKKRLPKNTTSRIVFWVRVFVFAFMFWKPGKCFYRSFALAAVLRKRGIPLLLNFGWRNIDEFNKKVKGHCWVSFNSRVLAEKNDPMLTYPIQIGTYKDTLQYWTAQTPRKKDLPL